MTRVKSFSDDLTRLLAELAELTEYKRAAEVRAKAAKEVRAEMQAEIDSLRIERDSLTSYCEKLERQIKNGMVKFDVRGDLEDELEVERARVKNMGLIIDQIRSVLA